MDYAKVRRVLFRVLILNWFVASLKIAVGFLSGSIAILADGVHSFFDGLSNIIGLVGIHYAKRPKDAKHPYGYTKYEALAALGIMVFILLGGYEIARGIVDRILNPVTPNISFLFLGVLGIALVVDVAVAQYEYHWGKKLKSKLLTADARHTVSHLLTTSAVIGGSAAIMAGFTWVDVAIASAVWLMIVRLVLAIFKDVRGVLTDSALFDTFKIQAIVDGVPQVESSHDIRSRGDRHAAFIDLHIVVSPTLSLTEAHRVSHNVRDRIMKEMPGVRDVIVHIEPIKR